MFCYCSSNSMILYPNTHPPPLFFAEMGGPSSAKDRLLTLNLPPEVTKTKSNTFPLAVSANQRWISPFQQSLRCSFPAWSYHWPINNHFTCWLLRQTSKHAERRECEGAIIVITLQSAITEGCGYMDVWQHSYRKFSQPLPTRCA